MRAALKNGEFGHHFTASGETLEDLKQRCDVQIVV